ncbi:MAG: energy transducer TonB [Nevskia sp.]|nr:energy transducer TonB [Nevskia sp.]
MNTAAAVQAGALRPGGGLQRLRWVVTPLAALAIVLLLVILMRWMIRAPEAPPAPPEQVDSVAMVKLDKEEDKPPEPMTLPDAAPPPPPAAPPSLARADLPPIPTPSISITPTPVEVAVGGGPVNLGSGLGLGSSGVFGGFGRGGGGNGNGGGAGGGGIGHGEGFSGKELVPLSTARPQMPEWACKQKIKGWVEAVFVVMPNGRVRDVRIVDADPRGVYEAAAIESISNWIYAETGHAREVDQRVPMDPDDCQYNWR